MKFKISRHAKEQIKRRSISLKLLKTVLDNPEQIVIEQTGKQVYQSQVDAGKGKTFLVRVIIDNNKIPPVVVTAYRTTNIKKYWRGNK